MQYTMRLFLFFYRMYCVKCSKHLFSVMPCVQALISIGHLLTERDLVQGFQCLYPPDRRPDEQQCSRLIAAVQSAVKKLNLTVCTRGDVVLVLDRVCMLACNTCC